MRSWSTLQNGEHFSCIGCHENKLEAGPRETPTRNTTVALSKPVQKLKPSAGKEHPLIQRLAFQSWLDSVENYLGSTPRAPSTRTRRWTASATCRRSSPFSIGTA